MSLAALDPGRSKCGLVLADPQLRRILQALVLPPDACWDLVRRWQMEQGLERVVLGNGTGSRAWQRRLQSRLPVELVEERETTLDARRRYWELFPPRGWRRWLPAGLRHPPRDWDDVAAQLLLERWLGYPLERQPICGSSLRRRPGP